MRETDPKTPLNPSSTEDPSFKDAKDADRKELCAYAAGSITDDVGNVAFANLASLLVIGFLFNPVLASMLTAIRLLWDGLMDPLVAHISDNFKSRFGRRRPFVLAGSLLMGLVSWLTWYAMPETDRIQPNVSPVPEHFYSDQVYQSFGRSIIAYQVEPTVLSLDAEANELPVAFEEIVAQTAREMTVHSRKRVGPLDAEADGASAAIDTVQLDFALRESGDNEFELELDYSLAGQPERRQTATVTYGLPPIEGLEKPPTNVFEIIQRLFTGPAKQTGMRWELDGVEYTTNLGTDRPEDQAVLAATRLSTMFAVAQVKGLPFYKVQPESFTLPEGMQEGLWERFESRLIEREVPWEGLLRSHGFMESDEALGLPESTYVEALNLAENQYVTVDNPEGWELPRLLWDQMDIEAGAIRQGEVSGSSVGGKRKSAFERIAEGFTYVFTLSAEDQKLVWFVMCVFIVMATAQTLHGASYWALGIEIAPSYEGRTRAMAYRSVTNGTFSFVAASFLPLSLMPFFTDFQEGNLTLATFALFAVVPLALWCFLGCKERTVVVRSNKKKVSFWRSVREIGTMAEFWRLAALYFFLGKVIGVFRVFGMFLIVYYVCDGNLLLGTSYNAIVQALTMGISILAAPVVVWLCNRFDKQTAFRMALAVLLIGAAAQYFLYNPDIPELIFLTPFIYGLAHSALYNILATMMADVTDLDELKNGDRREGMFGAVVAVFNKSTATFSVILSGALVVAVGFEVEKGALQDPGVFHNMLLAFSIIPAIVGMVGFFLLVKYPLSRERCVELKEILAVQRARTHAENLTDASV